ncbi:hypothetical protein EST38_g10553 [Candolleomyces aberdarensis]|uniref:DNA2/NAM7 helicase helicase domain-containing protein n=1 Tax=Candolleomyces aberdarensis TaxID=2316362 RepID=A0A4Q2D8Q6_9AGAR|nr:hypothetical protein EST38_g10553 [Candolleomyces aberdarensis]
MAGRYRQLRVERRAGRQLRNQEFDVVIDEATQVIEAVCWVPIAGDPLQLPPIILSLKQEERKNEKQKKASVSKSKKPTSKGSSKTGKKTGDQKVENPPSGEDDNGTDEEGGSEVSIPQSKTGRPRRCMGQVSRRHAASPIVFFDTSGCEYFEKLDGDSDEGSRCNENEGTIVKNWVEKLVAAGILPEQIAIITPCALINTSVALQIN